MTDDRPLDLKPFDALPPPPRAAPKGWHGGLTVALLLIAAALSGASLWLLARNILPESAALLVGSIVGSWSTLAGAAVQWWFGSSAGARDKDQLLAARAPQP